MCDDRTCTGCFRTDCDDLEPFYDGRVGLFCLDCRYEMDMLPEEETDEE